MRHCSSLVVIERAVTLLLCGHSAGQSLTNFAATLDSYGIRSGSRVMVLASKVGFLVWFMIRKLWVSSITCFSVGIYYKHCNVMWGIKLSVTEDKRKVREFCKTWGVFLICAKNNVIATCRRFVSFWTLENHELRAVFGLISASWCLQQLVELWEDKFRIM